MEKKEMWLFISITVKLFQIFHFNNKTSFQKSLSQLHNKVLASAKLANSLKNASFTHSLDVAMEDQV